MSISIIIPSLNEEEFIGGCLNSLKNQTVQADEIIVIDAHSIDKTVDVALQYTDKVYPSEYKNIGMQRQQGLEISTGDIIISCDADSLYPSNFIEKMVEPFSDPEVVGVYGDILPLNSNLITSINCSFRNSFLVSQIHNRGCCFAFRRNCCGQGFCDICYREGYSFKNFNEIQDIISQLKKNGKIVHTHEAFAYTEIPVDQQMKTVAGVGGGYLLIRKIIGKILK